MNSYGLLFLILHMYDIFIFDALKSIPKTCATKKTILNSITVESVHTRNVPELYFFWLTQNVGMLIKIKNSIDLTLIFEKKSFKLKPHEPKQEYLKESGRSHIYLSDVLYKKNVPRKSKRMHYSQGKYQKL